MAITCVHACRNCSGKGWVSVESRDDMERLVVTDYRCACRGVMCMACQFGAACWVTGEMYTGPAESATFWDENGAEDFERLGD
ncbi:hypothetical protein [Nocardiopsis deserti]|uniref:hypothetical protein n=1 Tax=Nocardiopsis deserti TaxID=2605988 RepID=UPI001238D8E6|nr:hypothetical protein [Nocardiopsis deserti]